ncbi:MFS transporter, partial [Glycomyces tenuis]
LTVSLGRRRALAAGAASAAVGSLVVTSGALASALALIVAGSALLGAGGAAVMLCRYAAAETVSEPMRAKAMASVLTATTVGAVAGPNLLAPASRAAADLGLPALGGAYVFGAAAFALMAVVLAAGPRGAAAGARAAEADAEAASTASAAPGLTVLALSNLVMVAVMTMAPVQMEHAGGHLGGIGLMVSVHIAGMFAPSPVSARLVGRLGARRAAALAGLVMAASCTLAAADAHSTAALTAAMALLGAGWNLGLVSGSALLTASLPREVRLRREGLGEVVMGVAAALGGLACGPLVAVGGYPALAACGAVAAALVPGLVGRLDQRV